MTNTDQASKPIVDGWQGTRFGKPEVGASASTSKTFGEREVELFSEITGDRNPLHNDEDAARASMFGGLITQGGVTSGLLNAVVAEQLPGPGTVFLSTRWDFRKPTYFGDTMTATVVVDKVRADKPICHLTTTVTNSEGEVCIEGEAVTYTAALT
ncbi:MaoC family dehydratase [Ornithinimicrobium faecis]|uniref:MaoC family dehydratase n=1 Tax=Ornithinimicrobium faecis TaxID=2934158 RepID=A0ABY4YXP7_9MICO|nr:MaoC family dehydratase [Ornithinimicrobium sp. HY1793]USQ81304.1 MaoC family dehydratase [Ornithinimicrobium sp. HY1793]